MEEYDYDLGGTSSNNGAGFGLELLMNNRVKDNSKKYFNTGSLDDVTNLDQTLNDIGGGGDYRPQSSLFGDNGGNDAVDNGTSGLSDIPLYEEQTHVNFNENPTFADANTPSWDDYSKYENIPDGGAGGGSAPRMNEEQMFAEKMKIIRELESYERRGFNLLKKYTLSDSLAEMQAELRTLKAEENRRSGIMFQKQSLLWCMHGLEFLNGWARPIDGLDISGFSHELEERMNEEDFETVLAELYEKYKGSIALYPELKLLFLIGGGMTMFTVRKNITRGFANMASGAMHQYPDATQMMEQSMLNAMMGGGQQGGGPPMMGTPMMQSPSQHQPHPYMSQSAGLPNPPYVPPRNAGAPPASVRTRSIDPVPMAASAGARYNGPSPASQAQGQGQGQSMRPEMLGPRDINSVFSGLSNRNNGNGGGGGIKTRVLDVPINNGGDDTESVVTIDDIKGGNVPRRTRKPRTATNNAINL